MDASGLVLGCLPASAGRSRLRRLETMLIGREGFESTISTDKQNESTFESTRLSSHYGGCWSGTFAFAYGGECCEKEGSAAVYEVVGLRTRGDQSDGWQAEHRRECFA